VVYADPPTEPRAIQVRHRRTGENRKYQTWGTLQVPLGAWRLKPNQHQILIVVEGMFDMLALAQAVHDRGLHNLLPLYTGGASVSSAMLTWFETHPEYAYILIPDGDRAGSDWTAALQAFIQKSGGLVHVTHPPEGLDPDEALMQGWWPESL
jgi:DNA primase